MSLLTNAWFWAFIAMFGLQCASFVVSGQRLGPNLVFTTCALLAVTVGRILLVLPFCPQPRFDISIWNWIIGGVVLLVAGVIGLPAMSIKWWRAPDSQMRLRTSWPYSLVRHPMYLSEILWPIGWSIGWGSIYGLALTPIWWIGFLLHALIEENQLDEKLGSRYHEYKKHIPGRIFPRLPI